MKINKSKLAQSVYNNDYLDIYTTVNRANKRIVLIKMLCCIIMKFVFYDWTYAIITRISIHAHYKL